MNKVMVLGGGYMGSGIAQVCAASGYDVVLWDTSAQLAQKGKSRIAETLDKRIAKGKETEEGKYKLLEMIEAVDDINKAREADIVIEAIIENIEIKKNVLRKAEEACKKETLIATNTSYLSITELASCLERPENFLGIHFFGPVPAMKLVELIKGKNTDDKTIEKSKNFALSIGKTPVIIKKDSPGFLVNRINAAIRSEAYRCYEEGIASISDIDTALKLGLNHPMGPFELNDMSGLDVGLAGLETMYKATGEERWKPIDKVYELVHDGQLGRKTGIGWYDYESGEKKIRNDINGGQDA